MKVGVISSSRADYGLLFHTLMELRQQPGVELQFIVTGSHLQQELGYTIEEIREDGIPIRLEMPYPLRADSRLGCAKAASSAMWEVSDALEQLRPDLLLLVGDRYEMLSFAFSACLLGIPIAHLHGGETTLGAFDDQIRHAITKLSWWHFATTDLYRNRIIQMGEDPERVFNVGAPGVENAKRITWLTRPQMETQLGFALQKRFAIVTLHPETAGGSNDLLVEETLAALDSKNQIQWIFTQPNVDPEGRRMWDRMKTFRAGHFVSSLGKNLYLSLLQESGLVLGNSSSGILEAPALHAVTVNIGERQKGRLSGTSVLHCPADRNAISQAIAQSESVRDFTSPYGEGDTSKRILQVILNQPLPKSIQKPFRDFR